MTLIKSSVIKRTKRVLDIVNLPPAYATHLGFGLKSALFVELDHFEDAASFTGRECYWILKMIDLLNCTLQEVPPSLHQRVISIAEAVLTLPLWQAQDMIYLALSKRRLLTGVYVSDVMTDIRVWHTYCKFLV